MLRYSVKLNTSDSKLKLGEVYPRECVVSRDLSSMYCVFPSTDNINDGDTLFASSSYSNLSSDLSVSAYNVTRSGYVVVEGKEYEVHSGKTCVESQEVNYEYIVSDGISYYGKIVARDLSNNGIFTIDRWLIEKDDGGKKHVEEGAYEKAPIALNGVVSIDTIYYIEDGTVTIDGNTFYVETYTDASGSTIGYITDSEDGFPLSTSSITECSDIRIVIYQDSSEYEDVTHSVLTRKERMLVPFDSLSMCEYYAYAEYLSYLSKAVPEYGEDGSVKWYCELPSHILKSYSAYTYDDVINDDALAPTKFYCLDSSGNAITSAMTPYELVATEPAPHIEVNGEWFNLRLGYTDNAIGNDLIIRQSSSNLFGIGERIRIVSSHEDTLLNIYPDDGESTYDGECEENEYYVIFNGTKHYIVPRLCDLAVIGVDGEEATYKRVAYRKDGRTAIVFYDGEEIPMELEKTDNGWYVLPYGVYSGGTSYTYDKRARYKIERHDGVTINGVDHSVDEYNTYDDNDERSYYVTYKGEVYNDFDVVDIIGSNAVIAHGIASYEFGKDEARAVSEYMASWAYNLGKDAVLYKDNHVFGLHYLDHGIGFYNHTSIIGRDGAFPKSVYDADNLFESLRLYKRSSYINMPIALATPMAIDGLRDDIVDNSFVKFEEGKAINPIVDMEKDVYKPKIVSSGDASTSPSEVVFTNVKKLHFALHFRDRSLETWKVKEGGNWFITEYGTYESVLGGDNTHLYSDIVGLLGFANYDVFYQKSNISKSFLRLSFYDSMDTNNQSLLCTSTIFMDGRKLFKTYVDNMKTSDNTFVNVYDTSIISNSISTMSECRPLDASKRLSSELVVTNNIASKWSSEGFYLYIFREYGDGLHPKPIYMKAEFNHAGIGQTIPFTIPMKWEKSDDKEYYYPEKRLGTNITDELNTLKMGDELHSINAKLYVPLYAVFDYKNNEYCYYFDKRYVIKKDEELYLNFFELKINDGEKQEKKPNEIYDIDVRL